MKDAVDRVPHTVVIMPVNLTQAQLVPAPAQLAQLTH
jgi:hypothetical protein